MKKFFFSLLVITFSSNIFSQSDTLISIENVSFPCNVTYITDQTVKIFHKKSNYTTFNLKQLNSIIINNYGEVYTGESGFRMDIDFLQTILENRESFRKQNATGDETFKDISNQNKIDEQEQSKFSFGIFYIPYTVGNKDVYQSINYRDTGPRYYLLEKYNADIEYNVGYKIKNETYMQFGLAYTSNSNEITSNNRTTIKDPLKIESYSHTFKNSLDVLTLKVGVKFFLKEYNLNKVIPFIVLDFAKSFAWATEEFSVSNINNPTYTETNNREDFLGQINSPYQIRLGGGVEYFFNTSISVYSAVIFGYEYTPEAEFNRSTDSLYSKNIFTEKRQSSEVETKVGVGLNFYF